MKSLLFIGGTGFVGKSFLKYFDNITSKSKKFSKIILISRNKKKIKTKLNVEYIIKNIANLKKLPLTNYIIYAANSKSSTENIKSINNFRHLLSEKHKKSKILFTSSGAVYGPINLKKKSIEKDRLSLKKIQKYKSYKESYAKDKIIIEKIFQNLGMKGFNVSIARLFSFIGNEILHNKNYAISNLFHQSKDKNTKFIKLNSTSKVYRSYMHTSDLTEWLIKILDRSSKTCPIYNVGSNEEISIDNLAKMIGKKYNKKLIFNKNMKKKIEDYYVPSINKAQKELGLSIKKKLSDSIKIII
jgi:nucleoside-diphosphate-sugar epimerase